MTLSGMIARLLLVPPEPSPPHGSPGTLEVFRASRAYYRYRLVAWLVGQLVSGAALVLTTWLLVLLPGMGSKPPPPEVLLGFRVFVIGAWLVYGLALVLSLAALTLDYELRWYMVTDRSLRIREGVLTVHELTLTFANVQEVSIEQGPLERALGIANLRVRTAGGSTPPPGQAGAGPNLHEGWLRGIESAEQLRDLVLSRMKAARGAGLGDPDEATSAEPATERDDALLAARAARLEAGRLRAVAEAWLARGRSAAG